MSNLDSNSMYLPVLLSFVLIFSLGAVNGVSQPTNGRKSKLASSPTQAFPTECGKQYYSPTGSQKSVGYVVGGETARANSWPWQVQLGEKNTGFCGGALIDTRHVLTAAHCFDDEPKPLRPSVYKIYVSMHDQFHVYEEETMAVEKIWLHEQYNKGTSENDIAIVRLAKPVTISEKVNVICLPGPEATKAGEEVWVVGWGHTSYNGRSSRLLQQASLNLMPNGCGKVYKGQRFNTQKQICAGVHGGKRDSCQGDSGGPLMYQKNGVWYLNGVVSYGEKCAVAGYPGVYARVSYYMPWIRSKIGGTPSKTNVLPNKTGTPPKKPTPSKGGKNKPDEETTVITEETTYEETITTN